MGTCLLLQFFVLRFNPSTPFYIFLFTLLFIIVHTTWHKTFIFTKRPNCLSHLCFGGVRRKADIIYTIMTTSPPVHLLSTKALLFNYFLFIFLLLSTLHAWIFSSFFNFLWFLFASHMPGRDLSNCIKVRFVCLRFVYFAETENFLLKVL